MMAYPQNYGRGLVLLKITPNTTLQWSIFAPDEESSLSRRKWKYQVQVSAPCLLAQAFALREGKLEREAAAAAAFLV